MKHYFYNLGIALVAGPVLVVQGLLLPFKALVGLFDYREHTVEEAKANRNQED